MVHQPENRFPSFTLIELLVVIAIIAILMTLLLPSLQKARALGKLAACTGAIRKMNSAWQVYAEDYDGNFCLNRYWCYEPAGYSQYFPSGERVPPWYWFLAPYLGSPVKENETWSEKVVHSKVNTGCPDESHHGWEWGSYGLNLNVAQQYGYYWSGVNNPAYDKYCAWKYAHLKSPPSRVSNFACDGNVSWDRYGCTVTKLTRFLDWTLYGDEGHHQRARHMSRYLPFAFLDGHVQSLKTHEVVEDIDKIISRR